eukprot:CAMPEP_0176503402 /NCGR_PEP_ID=MMETSP0200_2-20121128/15343_1 /TAXON_ID=947934 /ORGANISM="Chaetoceros sp., Strain GSL56" /LENGTH=762 /DNA_ID=CAMNT_0017902689 /DNA_START=2361 /DNA_END=4649 /DNA_ORIENTATION=-
MVVEGAVDEIEKPIKGSITTTGEKENGVVNGEFCGREVESIARDEVLGVSVYHLDTVFKKCSTNAIVSAAVEHRIRNNSSEQRHKTIMKKKRLFFMRKNKNPRQQEQITTNSGKNLSPSPNIYDIVDCVIKEKGRNVTCPRDGRLGAAYVDCLYGEDHVGKANVMISYGWGNKVEEICAVLVKYCNEHKLDMKRTYVWICCLCNNQFRVDEQSDVPFEEFEQIFEDKVVGIKNIVSLMSPWNSPVYLTRVWCIFELHKAYSNECNLMIAMPPEEELKMIESVLRGEDVDEGTGGIHDLYDALNNTNIEDAQASREDDRKRILQMVEETTGAEVLNNQVNDMLRKWISKILDEFAARESLGPNGEAEQIRLAWMLNRIGLVYDNQGEYDNALEYYERAHSIKNKVLGPDHPDLATTYNNMGSIYENQGDYQKALDYYEKARDLQKNNPDQYNNLANTYNNIGLVYDNLEDYDRALENYQLCKDIRMNLFGRDHLSLANVVNNIGSVYDKQGEFSNALECYDNARILEERFYGKNHPQLATTYSNIGLVHSNQGKFGKALEYYEMARVIEEKVFGKDHPDIATSYNNIGGVYDNEGKYEMALKYYKMAFDIERRCLGEDHPALASTCNNIGGMYNDMGDYDRAIEYYEMALTIEEKVFGRSHPELVSNLVAIGAAYCDKGIYDMSLTYYRKAQNVQEKINGKNDTEYAYILNNIGGVHMKQGKNSIALTCFEDALTILKRTLGSDHVNTVAVSDSIAYLTSLKK